MNRNRHPVDELADVRAEMKRLHAREEELRQILLSLDEADLVGDQHEAAVSQRSAERIDTEALKREWGRERLAPFLRKSEFAVIKLRQRELLEEVG